MVRTVDELGRLVIPKELRRLLGLKEGKDSFEIFIDDNKNVILRKLINDYIKENNIDI